MINLFKKIFGSSPKTDFANLVKEGAVILDVRSPAEFKQSHIKGAINLPLNELENHIPKFKKDQTIITCCASGMRSASAARFLKSQHFTRIHNAGGWNNLANKIA